MSAAPSEPSTYDASPERAIEAVGAHRGPLFVDLDETLYLRNSTEDFIDQARPGLIAVLLLRLVDSLRLWKLTGGAPTRDVWRVGLIWMLFPWTRARWRARAPELAREHGNQALVAALQGNPEQVVILTAGFRPIVEPLVAALGFPQTPIVAARLASFADRRKGKLHAALNALGHESVCSSLVVTDSLDDLPLLAQCARPLRTVWPGARFRRALQRVYLPGEYLTQVKRPGQQYVLRVIIQEDLVFWILSSVWLAPNPWLHILGLAFLLASFWTIYERGYVDNDWAAAHLEHDGKLSASFWQAPVATPALLPWVWALAFGSVAVTLLEWPAPKGVDGLKWAALLVGTYVIFKIYNRIDKATRVWVYAALQLARAAALMVLVPVPTVGAAALAALALERWVGYYMYRLGGQEWPEQRPNLARLLILLVLAAVLGASEGIDKVLNWTAASVLLWTAMRARSELLPALARVRLLRRTQGPREGQRAASG